MDRRAFARVSALGAAGLALAPVLDLLEGSEPTPVPDRVGATEVAQIRTAAKVFAGWDLRRWVGTGGGAGAAALVGRPTGSGALLRAAPGAAVLGGGLPGAFSHAKPANDPPWMACYDAAQHAGDTGHALFDLAAQGRPAGPARDRLAAAVSAHTDAYARSRMISRVKLASLTMATGDPTEGVVIGHRVLDAASGVRSSRAADDLRELARYSNRHTGISDVAELRQRITTVVLDS